MTTVLLSSSRVCEFHAVNCWPPPHIICPVFYPFPPTALHPHTPRILPILSNTPFNTCSAFHLLPDGLPIRQLCQSTKEEDNVHNAEKITWQQNMLALPPPTKPSGYSKAALVMPSYSLLGASCTVLK